MRNSCIILILMFLSFGMHTLFAEPFAKIVVQTGQYTRFDTPVSVLLRDSICPTDLNLICLEEEKGDQRISLPCQIEAGVVPKLWFILTGETSSKTERIFFLSQGAPPDSAAVELEKNDAYIQIRVAGKDVLRYNHASVVPPPKIDPVFTRSAFIHPLWSPSGPVLTEIHPVYPDAHEHHVGIWMPWTKTEFEGKPVDFWNLKLGEGTVHFKEFKSMETGPVYARFQALQEHVVFDKKYPQGEKKALDEIWDICVFNVGGPGKGYWLLDFVSIQSCASESPLNMLQYRYGGLGFRGAKEWAFGNGDYLTSEGFNKTNGHATRARWCDIYGQKEQKWAGVSILSHTQNFSHPETVRLWPKKDDALFFGYAPCQLGDWAIEPGIPYITRYRFYVHEQKPISELIEQFWRDFTLPPVIALEKYPLPADHK